MKYGKNILLKGNSANVRLFVLLGLAAAVGFVIFLGMLLSPVTLQGEGREVVVAIPQEAVAATIGKILEEEGLVRSSVAFNLYTRCMGLDARIKAGHYVLNSGFSTPRLAMELVNGQQVFYRVTIPEGFNTEQIADLLAEKGLVERDRFMAVVREQHFDFSFLQGVPKGDRRLEGYLFPDTYNFELGVDEGTIVETMLNRFDREMKELDYATLTARNGINVHQAVTIASLIEREAKADEERPLIAGVIYNRLKIPMLLQIDATIQYALGENKPIIYYKDLEVDSPYNTYKHYGLPPGPIAMPGRASLLAAVQPAATDYLYYVAKPDGSHAFATTLSDHDIHRELYQ
jgi:UPF0755 protein